MTLLKRQAPTQAHTSTTQGTTGRDACKTSVLREENVHP